MAIYEYTGRLVYYSRFAIRRQPVAVMALYRYFVRVFGFAAFAALVAVYSGHESPAYGWCLSGDSSCKSSVFRYCLPIDVNCWLPICACSFGADRPQISTVKCPGAAIWDERFKFVAGLVKSENYAKATSILEGALSDCDPAVRHRAIAILAEIRESENPSYRPKNLWRSAKPKVMDAGSLVLKSVVVLLLAGVLYVFISLIAGVLNRRKIALRPLTVSNGGGFDGQHFVAIAFNMASKIQAMQHAGARLPGISAAAPRMMLDSASSAVGDLVGALATDEAGKLATVFLAIFQRPRYICAGSVHIAGRSTHILVRLERGSRVIGTWERTSQVARLIEDLKDLSYSVLQAASAKT